MKITTRLTLMVLIPLLMGGLTCLLVALNHSGQKESALCGRVAFTVGKGVNEVNRAIDDYVAQPGADTRIVWQVAYENLQATMENSPALPRGAEPFLEEAMYANQSLPSHFDALTKALEPTTDSGTVDRAAVEAARQNILKQTDAVLSSVANLVEEGRVSCTQPPMVRLGILGGISCVLALMSFVSLRRLSAGLDKAQYLLAKVIARPVENQISTDIRLASKGDELDILNSQLGQLTRELLAVREELSTEVKAREEAAGALRGANVQISETMSRLRRAQAGILQQERVQALRQIARGVVHDVNDALMPLVGISELYRLYPDQLANHKEVAESFERIHDAAGQAEKVIRNLATFCSPTATGLTGRVNLSRVVNEVLSAAAGLRKDHAPAGAPPIEFKAELGQIPDFRGDVTELADALTAVLINSIEAMTTGGTVTIKTFQDNGTAVLEVSDTGPGMLPEVAQRCLEPFFSTKGKGHSGMGLTAVQGALARAGGSLKVDTDKGKGTTISFLLPMTLAPEREAIDTTPFKSGRPLSVLAIDDEPWTAHVVERHLKADGHTVKTVTSGREGLDSVKLSRYDVVLLDRVMPDMNGDEVAAALKETNPGLPIIMLTGFGIMMADQGDVPHGVDVVLSKPVKQADLRNAIRRVVNV